MIIRFRILSPSDTGAPDYIMCNQGSTVIDPSNLSLNLSVGGTVIFNTPNLGLVPFPIFGPVPIGSTGLFWGSLDYSSVTGLFEMDIIGLELWQETTFEIKISKLGYIPFINIFNLFGYDVGNGTGPVNNPELDVYLVDETNHLDVNGRQTKAYSKFTVWRKPFTNLVYYYNLVGTQGNIVYEISTTPLLYSSGQRGIICTNETIDIVQSVEVQDIYNTTYDICESTITSANQQWLPTFNTTVTCDQVCNDCVSNLSQNNVVTTIIDVSTVPPVRVNDSETYPFYNTNSNLEFLIYNYLGVLIDSYSQSPNFNNYPSIIPNISYSFSLPQIGDVVINATLTLENIYECSQVRTVSVCNWFTIEPLEECNKYKITNCSVDDKVVTIKQLQDNSTFTVVSTVNLLALESTNIEFEEDGIYSITVLDIDGNEQIQIVASYCNLNNCILNYLKQIICNKPCGDCKTENVYNFNALMINAHTYFALINEQFNFNYIYSTIDISTIDRLYEIKSFIERFSEYCENDCNCGCEECK